ncbi:MAG: 3-deoxy-manno-octulosonate cytidylyltransferase [Wenzhouxiangellaceae bacterium]|nr:3-deoxy-manno-octulosonate cytidylyltransferase [Wenzhouxiangellaceae bacterium]
MTVFHVLIPARLESSRLPRKALADLGGRPMVVRAWEQACRAGALSVHVATDSEAIAAAVDQHGGRVVQTAREHASGTARLGEAAVRLGFGDDEIVVNVQGDEPAMPPDCVRQVAALLRDDAEAMIATLWAPMHERAEWLDPNAVKIVTDTAGRALYFSRAPIPACRDGDWPDQLARRHIGLYAYRVRALKAWSALPESRLAQSESLEQLQALDAGWTITCAEACAPIPPGVDTPADLEAMRRRFAGGSPVG